MKIKILALLLIISLTACAGMKPAGRSMSGDLGSPEKIELLRQRVNDFWTAFIDEDYEKNYYIYDPFYQSRTNKYTFMGSLGRIKYHEFEIKDIKVEGNVAKVRLSYVYSLPNFKLRMREFSVPESTIEREEKWLYIYDNWYKEYYVEMIGRGVVEY